MKTVIITGAAGFVGIELTKKMIENGINVIAISRHFNDEYPKSSLIKRIEGELDEEGKLLNTVPKGVYDAFYHLAWTGVNGNKKADPFIQLDNIKVSLCCARESKRLGCKKFLCAGTVAENAVKSMQYLKTTNGSMIYGAAKNCAHIMLEAYCKSIKVNFVWMQFSNIYGPKNKTGNLVSYTLEEVLHRREATFGPALQPYDLIFIDDLIEAVFRLGFNNTKDSKYLIGSGSPRLLKDYLIEIGEICGTPELIKIGKRPDDGIIYSYEMFDSTSLIEEIGTYVSVSFSEGIRYTIDNY